MGEATALKIMSKEDLCKHIVSFISTQQNTLLMANSEQVISKTVVTVVNYLKGVTSSIPELSNIIADVNGTARALLLHDATRKEFNTCLDILLNEVEKIQAQEQAAKEKKKKVLILTSICNFVSDHAEEFIDMIPPEVFEV